MEIPQPVSIDNELKDHYIFSETKLLPCYLQVLGNELHQQAAFISSVKRLFEQYEQKLERDNNNLILHTRSFHEALKDLIAHKHDERNKSDFDERFAAFNTEVAQYVSGLERQMVREQDKERFFAQPEESIGLNILKYNKRVLYSFSQFPVKTSNIFRKIFRRPVGPPKVWLHQIPLQQIFNFYFRDELASEMKTLFYETNSFLSSNSHKLQQLASRPDETILNLGTQQAGAVILSLNLSHVCGQLTTEANNFEKTLSAKASEISQRILLRFRDAYRKVNTIELSGKKFSSQNLAKKHSALNHAYETMSQRWANTHFTIYERWRMDEERLVLKYSLFESLEDSIDTLRQRIDLNIIPHLQSIAEVLQKSEDNVSHFAGDKTELRAILIKERRTILKDLRHTKIPIAVESLVEQALASLVGGVESALENKITHLPRKTTLSKNKEFSKETRSSDLQSFSLHELLSYDTFPEFRNVLGQTKSTIVQDLDKVQKSLLELSSISDFNLESALAMLEREDKSVEESVVVAKEGLQRAASKCGSIENEILELREKVLTNLELAVNGFNNQLDILSDTDNIFDLQIRIAKAKAIGKGKAYKGRALKIFRTTVPFIKNYSSKTTKKALQYYQSLKDQYGLAKVPTLISAEISDYLAEVKSSISLLPFVYQRLFDIAPLKDRNFYEERTREMGVLKKAYENWDKGYFAPVVIVGEKGAGATTLINFFIKDLPTNYKVLKANDFQDVPDQEMLIRTISELFKVAPSNSVDEMVESINNLPDKYIIIIENLQQFYIRKVGGFDTLKIFLKIMSATHKKVFWISSCNTYTWYYLDKILDISDFFGYINFLEGLKDEQIIQVILKRHQVSGYNIQFEPSPAIRLSRKYRKLPDSEKQEYLRDQFFVSLNKFAKNNLSLALIYWLRSTKGVKGDVISFGFMNSFKFDFLAALSTQKITILQALLLHNMLTEKNISEILSKDLEDCKMLLLLLYDDGIIVKEENRYLINPLLYRQTVNLLQSKNFI